MLPQAFDLDNGFSHLKKFSIILGGSLLSEVLSTPLERAKIKLQTKPSTENPGFLHINDLNSYLHEIKTKEGRGQIFYGLRGLLDRAMAFNVARFYGYYLSMEYISNNKGHEWKQPDVSVALFLGTTLATILSQPSEIVRLKMQGEKIGELVNKQVGMVKKVNQIIVAYGNHKALVTGLNWNILTQNLQAFVEFFSFFAIRRKLTEKQEASYSINLASAFIASGLGAFVSTPFDFFHTRFVFRGLFHKETSYPAYILHTIKNEGLGGIYKTFLPHLYRNVIFNLSMVTILQYVCDTQRTESLFGEQPTKVETLNTVQVENIERASSEKSKDSI